MFNPVLLALSNQMRTQTLTSDYSRPFWVFVQLSSFKPIGSLVSSFWKKKKPDCDHYLLIDNIFTIFSSKKRFSKRI